MLFGRSRVAGGRYRTSRPAAGCDRDRQLVESCKCALDGSELRLSRLSALCITVQQNSIDNVIAIRHWVHGLEEQCTISNLCGKQSQSIEKTRRCGYLWMRAFGVAIQFSQGNRSQLAGSWHRACSIWRRIFFIDFKQYLDATGASRFCGELAERGLQFRRVPGRRIRNHVPCQISRNPDRKQFVGL